MRDRKLVGSQQRSLSRRSRHARPLLAGKTKNNTQNKQATHKKIKETTITKTQTTTPELKLSFS